MKRLVLALSALLLAVPAARAEGDAAKGETVFRKCKACHEADTATNKVGPHLGDVVGRVPGTVADYNYSEPMKAFGAGGAKWDEATIDKYLENPKATVPGNKMAFPGLKKPEDRANVIAYLKSKAAPSQ